MFKTLAATVPQDKDYPQRTWELEVYRRVLDGTIYDELKNAFHDEKNSSGEYIPLKQRRPSVRYNLARIVVQDSASLLFGEGHFPKIISQDKATDEALTSLVKETLLNSVMLDLAERGSVGSAALLFRVMKNRVFFTRLETQFLTPEWDPEAPDTLVRVTERYKVAGETLVSQGYDIPEVKAQYWFTREWGPVAETWFEPMTLEDAKQGKKLVVDDKRTVKHGLGFVPVVWVKNLPGGNGIDGQCTFRAALDTMIEIDYQLSQAGRGLRYSSDPTLLIKEPAGEADDGLVRSAANALIVSEKGDAKLLEINGTAASAVIEYTGRLREIALESIRGNRSSPDKLSAAQSGRALELLNQPLVWLADNLRVSYGETALLQLLRMVVLASQTITINVQGKPVGKLSDGPISLQWPRWFPPTYDDLVKQGEALAKVTGIGAMSGETATRIIAPSYDIEDVPAERAIIEKERAEVDARAIAQAAQVRIAETAPA